MLRSVSVRVQALVCLVCLAGALRAAAPAGIWLDVPFIPQENEGCGAASAAMVMQYWLKAQSRPADRAADVNEIQRTLYSTRGHGIYASDLEHYLQQHGFRTFAFAGAWDDLQQHLAKGRPLIAALRPARGAELHYVVVVGLDSGAANSELDIVLLNDPARRKLLKQPRATFEKQWSGAGRWLLVALPDAADKQPALDVNSQNGSHSR